MQNLRQIPISAVQSLILKSSNNVHLRSLHMRALPMGLLGTQRLFPYRDHNIIQFVPSITNNNLLKIRFNYFSSKSNREGNSKPRSRSSEDNDDHENDKEKDEEAGDYVVFHNKSRIIQDVIDEEWNPLPENEQEFEYDPYQNVNRTRGKTGVFDIDEIVDLLYEERGDDICVIRIPQESKYADYMVIATARNPKQMIALGRFIRKRFKLKEKKSTDLLPTLEGIKHDNKDWLSLDLGNIILHLFTEEKRIEMDLETLWSVGPNFDDLTNAKDPEIVQLLNSFNGEERRHKW